jgi:hypothetical protein
MRKSIFGAGVAVAVLGVGGIALAGGFQFRATATPAEEVPPPGVVIISTAEAMVNLKLDGEAETVEYNLRVTEPIQELRQAHLHRGPAGTNGPIAVWLYPAAPPQQLIPGVTEGTLAKGTLTPASLCFSATAPYCPGSVPNWDGFVAAMESGGLYLNLHTTAYPGGEIRGQVHDLGHHHDD